VAGAGPTVGKGDQGGPLAGQVAIVTGAARGLGRAVAGRLAADGARIAMFDRAGEAVKRSSRALEELGWEAEAHEVDVTDGNSVERAVRMVVERAGGVDILVNNVGVFPHALFEEIPLQEWRRVLSINLDGMFLCSQAAYPTMRSRGYGRIVNVSSATFFIGYPGLTHYITSKAGVIGFTRALASEAGPYGITVNAIAPGLIETEGTLEEDPTGELFEEIVGGQAVKRRGGTEDITECLSYLVSPAAGFITGQTINVDGGHRYH
jgi:NAD(P)-dependent dehydrogenase (short-subunit alcohol dehydrogenase family)